MTDFEDAVEQFLQDADAVYDEYDQGYVDADAALSMLDDRLNDLRAAVEGAED
ncbi:hypothetical protein [Halomicrococcus sp. NG-SE-24]|uniref:hypothetical protein n=1 Tax=Halomicrococcus sp. NG-SE-24 TaxID=3436928 RepID=UPI00269386FB